MAKVTTYRVRYDDGKWNVEADGNKRPSAREARKSDAVSRAKEIADNQQPARVIVHKQDGSVQNELTFGDVPKREGGLAADAIFALAALSGDAVGLASEALQLARELPSKAQDRSEDLRDLSARREELDERVRQLREVVGQRFDEKATEGRSLAENILHDERIQRVLEQARATQTQVKAALTSIRKIAERATRSAAEAGKDQLDTAQSQVKAAATSVRKTAETAVSVDRAS